MSQEKNITPGDPSPPYNTYHFGRRGGRHRILSSGIPPTGACPRAAEEGVNHLQATKRRGRSTACRSPGTRPSRAPRSPIFGHTSRLYRNDCTTAPWPLARLRMRIRSSVLRTSTNAILKAAFADVFGDNRWSGRRHDPFAPTLANRARARS